VDLSLESDGWPGGMLLRVPTNMPGVDSYVDEAWSEAFAFGLLLPGLKAPLTLRGRVVRLRGERTGESVEVVLQYRPMHRPTYDLLRSFWQACRDLEQQEREDKEHLDEAAA